MILAQYTIRAKQEYIFKTNRVLEIIGASENIANIWEELFKLAHNNGILCQRSNEKFQMEQIKMQFEKRELSVVELFCGGGNETVLFSDKESFIKLNRLFSYQLLDKYPGMIPMAVYVEVTGNYSDDYKRLMQESEKKKNVMEPQWDMFTVPFAMMDRSTFQPYSSVKEIGGQPVRMSDECRSKYEIGQKLRNEKKEIRFFDEMVTAKGKESLLAVVHADGNNMGTKIMGMLKGEQEYDKAVVLMREFTKTTADCFETKGDKALEDCFERLIEANSTKLADGKVKERSFAYRRVIGSGDDVTFICNARYVMDYVKAYMESVQSYKQNSDGDWAYSSCVGICIFHSHYPFAKAYELAEQACDNAKKKVHLFDTEGKPVIVEQGWVDFHYVRSGISGALDEIRRSQETKACIARPWLVTYEKDDTSIRQSYYKYDNLLALDKLLKEFKVARTTIKNVGAMYERSKAAAEKELIAWFGHTAGLEDRIKKLYPTSDEDKDENKYKEIFLKALYDLAEMYDLWFAEVK